MEACLLFLEKLYLRSGLNLVSQMDVLVSWQILAVFAFDCLSHVLLLDRHV